MEKFLERWLQVRREYLGDDANDSSSTERTNVRDEASNNNEQGIRLSGWLRLRHLRWVLCTIVEWIIAWTLILAFSAWYLLEYARLQWVAARIRQRSVHVHTTSRGTSRSQTTQDSADTIPATCMPQTRIQQKETYWRDVWAEFIDCGTIVGLIGNKNPIHPISSEELIIDEQHDQQWINFLRRNLRARQLASLILVEEPQMQSKSSPSSMLLLSEQERDDQDRIRSILRKVWPLVLEFPRNKPPNNSHCPIAISLIISIYNDELNQIRNLLHHTQRTCQLPEQVQIILVDAGGRFPKEAIRPMVEELRFARVELVTYSGTRGRGGCLNYGASNARGMIFTFLHSDTLLPPRWDESIQTALLPRSSCINNDGTSNPATTTMCAFSMGIDQSPFQNHKARNHHLSYPAGLWGADRVLGYTRCSLCRLPYGDSVLSFPSSIFEYLGGYPDQPLMEDFEIVQLLRRRALLFPNNEQITILKDRIACSPRRWQRHGVPYVILSNAYCIYRYTQLGAPSEDIFEFYYRQSITASSNSSSQTTATNKKKEY
jgi:hypothetical protein